MWCLYVCMYAKRQNTGTVVTQRPKISIFAPQARLIGPIHVKFGTAERHVDPLGRAKFYRYFWYFGHVTCI